MIQWGVTHQTLQVCFACVPPQQLETDWKPIHPIQMQCDLNQKFTASTWLSHQLTDPMFQLTQKTLACAPFKRRKYQPQAFGFIMVAHETLGTDALSNQRRVTSL